jgi:predicted heme/steroid binding protein
MNEYTLAELAHRDGREGRDAWVAYQGRIYDVTRSFLWQEGRHQAMHQAGCDLTEALDEAPHGEDLFERVPLIGILLEV